MTQVQLIQVVKIEVLMAQVFPTVDVVKFGSDVTTDFEFYLARIDKIFLDKEGYLKVVKGGSSLNPQMLKELDNAMHLYTLSLSPYTFSTEEIEIEQVDNRRYTMRDIGKLERRIENVEYYTQLSLLETIKHKIYKYKTQMVLIDLKMDLL